MKHFRKEHQVPHKPALDVVWLRFQQLYLLL